MRPGLWRITARGFFGGRARPRRTGSLRSEGDSPWRHLADWLASPRTGAGVLVAVSFAALASVLVLWSRDRAPVSVGRVMDETRIVRVKLELPDRAQTEENREAARQVTPRVYAAIVPRLEAIEQSLENLPRALAGAQDLASVDESIRAAFALDEEMLAAVRAEAVNGEPTSAWKSKVATLLDAMRRRPILDEQTFQRSVQEGRHTTIRLEVGDQALPPVSRGEVVSVDAKPVLTEAMTVLARDAGFVGPLRKLVVNRLTIDPRPTYRFDREATARDQNAAADAMPLAKKESSPGQVIFQRGERLTQEQADLYLAESEKFASSVEPWRRVLHAGAMIAAVASITLGLVGYTVLFCPRIRRNVSRMVGLGVILLGALAAACVSTSGFPGLASLTVIAPTILVTLLISVGYDRRAALAYGLLHALLVCLALRQGIGPMTVIVTGVACVVTMIGNIRDRAAFVRLSLVTAVGVAIATAIFGIVERPIFGEAGAPAGAGRLVFREILQDAAVAAAGALVLGGATLFVLPGLERLFDVATGLTLIELRDPKHPLLRELQLRAPGTYNHSLSVAALSESAAEAIKADGLLAYVGALYHDVGKMNKPEYFVENQGGGPNRHDRLSPAMSLLVVVGHVKDGMELAKEYNLPRPVQHFIESHHGTTLVEYFFHRARQQAQQGGRAAEETEEVGPEEIQYRYPGPRPRTKEAAVLMICDAVESATRAMSDPTPSRIDALVRSIANKRLLDGQFDDCELTLRELTIIVESVSRTLASMYHGRISYPVSEQPKTSDVLVAAEPAGAKKVM